MKYSPLLQQWSILYNTVQEEIENGKSALEDEAKWIEWAFGVSVRTWLNVEKTAADHQFANQQEEIYFYKILKPRFTGLIDFFTLVYKSYLFQPEYCTKISAYWKSELSSCRKVIYWCRKGCWHFEQQQPEKHLPEHTSEKSQIFGININHFNNRVISYDCLLSRLVAMKQYQKFVLDKIHNHALQDLSLA